MDQMRIEFSSMIAGQLIESVKLRPDLVAIGLFDCFQKRLKAFF